MAVLGVTMALAGGCGAGVVGSDRLTADFAAEVRIDGYRRPATLGGDGVREIYFVGRGEDPVARLLVPGFGPGLQPPVPSLPASIPADPSDRPSGPPSSLPGDVPPAPSSRPPTPSSRPPAGEARAGQVPPPPGGPRSSGGVGDRPDGSTAQDPVIIGPAPSGAPSAGPPSSVGGPSAGGASAGGPSAGSSPVGEVLLEAGELSYRNALCSIELLRLAPEAITTPQPLASLGVTPIELERFADGKTEVIRATVRCVLPPGVEAAPAATPSSSASVSVPPSEPVSPSAPVSPSPSSSGPGRPSAEGARPSGSPARR